jgi:hypothetical protein
VLRKLAFTILLFSSFSYAEIIDIPNCGTVNNIAIPCWRDYLRKNEGDESLPFYPYAKRPNGCSVLNSRPGESDIFVIKGDVYNFKSACDAHDLCYYTLNSKADDCNQMFLGKMITECHNSGSNKTRRFCVDRARVFFDAVESSKVFVHHYSQNNEIEYLQRAQEYISEQD